MNNLSLYGITEEQLKLMNALEECEGELTPELEEALQVNEANFVEKSNGYVKMINYYKAFAESAKLEKQRIDKLQKSAESHAQRMTEALSNAMQVLGKDKVTTDNAVISLRKSQALIVDDEAIVPNEFKTYEVKIDKNGIKAAMKQGAQVEGVHIQENVNLIIK